MDFIFIAAIAGLWLLAGLSTLACATLAGATGERS
jgi:hypothetical protein